jgi:monoamine oxidase
MENSEQHRIDEGYSALIDFLEGEVRVLGAMIHMATSAKAIRWRPNAVEVEVLTADGMKQFEAEAAVVTLPLGVLKSGAVRFEPPLTEKCDAIQQLQFGNVIKIVFVFQKQWWPENDFGFIQSRGEPLPTWWSDPRGPILTGWAGGPKAEALANLTPKGLERLGLEILERIFGVSNLEQHLITSHFHDWSQDPNTLGAYSYIPVDGLDLPKLLAEPMMSTLYFAGEATVNDAQMGTVFGAYESGLRAAEQILGD